MTITAFVSYMIVSLCTHFDSVPAMFYVSLIASIMIGVQRSIGESTILGFLKGFPGESVGFFSSGTGFAGIFGSGILIILKAINLSDSAIYLIASPTVIPYFLSFWWLDKQRIQYEYVQEPDEGEEEVQKITVEHEEKESDE